MARARMVTRTIISTKAQILVCLTDKRTTDVETLSIPASVTPNKYMTYVQRKYRDTFGHSIVPVQILSTEKEETLMGMPEEQFIQLATVLPPRETVSDAESEEE